ncbi:cation:proton antiporter regulatory subunit [Catellatospora chokoriensis]|uniref:Potassium transporter TrkA n=1 Tax=Catellatospora chokoriensis TaxID=310353 RepID=A0A8J3NTR6_9ACTN|nr:TrkA C-terminal domain-containing protein [Catellatospora chokoriensis]GIF92322.1 potassium transporter TrkA [Catellatospora chokoriensis]
MTIIERSALPGIGMRYTLATVDGRGLAVICHPSGRRDLLVYSSPHAEVAHGSVSLTPAQAHDVAELLHTLGVVDRLAAAGLSRAADVAALPVPAGSPYAGRPLGELGSRLPAGISVLALIRDGDTRPGPDPDTMLLGGDVLVLTGGRPDLAAAAEAIAGHPT